MPNIWSRLQCRREGTVTCDVLSLWLLGQFVVGWAVILLHLFYSAINLLIIRRNDGSATKSFLTPI
jgi:hypothetical protein